MEMETVYVKDLPCRVVRGTVETMTGYDRLIIEDAIKGVLDYVDSNRVRNLSINVECGVRMVPIMKFTAECNLVP